MDFTREKTLLCPQILSYKSVLNYLTDFFQYRKSLNPNFSYDYWSLEMNFKSRAFMKMICSGQRNITDKFIFTFSKKMNFSEQEKLHFTLLARLCHSKSDKMKFVYQDSVLKTLDLDQERTDLDNKTFLSLLYNPVVQMLIGFKDFMATEENLLRILPLNITQLNLVLCSLQSLDLIYLDQKVWKSKIYSFRLEQTTEHGAMRKFHRKTLMESIQKIEASAHEYDEVQKNRSIYFSLKPESASELSVEIEDFLKKIRNKYGSETLEGQKVVKLNLQSYGVTQIFKKE